MIISLAMSLTMSLTMPALAQEEGAGVTRHHGRAAPKKTDTPAVKANDKDYKAALDRMPAQKYDPWGTMRPADDKH
jgi:hypothetical protein